MGNTYITVEVNIMKAQLKNRYQPLELNTTVISDIPEDQTQVVEALGLLPYWIGEHNLLGNTNNLVQFMTEKYGFGELFEFKGGEILEDGTYRYPKDPDLPWVGRMNTKFGYVYFYEYAMIALPQGDGTYFITRMD